MEPPAHGTSLEANADLYELVKTDLSLTREQKRQALLRLRKLFTDTGFQEECARVHKQAGEDNASHFQFKDLKGELSKAADIFDKYLGELEEGKHDYYEVAQDGNSISYREPYGRVMLMSAPNYPIGENATVIGLLNVILAGCPADFRLGSNSTGPLDEFMATRIMEELQGVLPEGFLGTQVMDRSKENNSDKVLPEYAGLHFIGGDSGVALLKKTKHEIGVLQTGRANWMIVEEGFEAKALEVLEATVKSRFGTSCSAPSIIFVKKGKADEMLADLRNRGQTIEEELAEAGEHTVMDKRFASGLKNDAGYYVEHGAKLVSEDGEYLTLLKIDQAKYDALIKGIQDENVIRQEYDKLLQALPEEHDKQQFLLAFDKMINQIPESNTVKSNFKPPKLNILAHMGLHKIREMIAEQFDHGLRLRELFGTGLMFVELDEIPMDASSPSFDALDDRVSEAKTGSLIGNIGRKLFEVGSKLAHNVGRIAMGIGPKTPKADTPAYDHRNADDGCAHPAELHHAVTPTAYLKERKTLYRG